MSALEWVRNKANQQPVEFMTISPEEAGDSMIAGTWRVTRFHFKGKLPSKMIYQIRDEKAHDSLVKIFDGKKQVNETLQVGGQYRSDFNNCVFSRTEYELIESGSILA